MDLSFRETIKAMIPQTGLDRLSDMRTALRRQRMLADLRREFRGRNATGKYVTYLVMQGMTNRFKAHVMAAHLAESLGRTLVPVWRKTPECHAAFEDLFDNPPAPWSYRSMKVVHYNVKTDVASAEIDALRDDPADLLVLDLDWQYTHMNKLLARIGGEPAFPGLFARTLRVRPDITDRVDAAVTAWGRPMVGVQLRRGDFVTFRQATPIERYIEAADAALRSRPEAGIFLSSDATRDELAPFLEHFGPRCLFRESKGREEEDGIRDAMYDLMLLSHCEYLILTPISGFGHMAAQIGGKPYEWV